MDAPNSSPSLPGGLTDADFTRTMLATLRLLAVLGALASAAFWWRMGWQSGLLCLIGAALSGASLWEWLRLLSAVMQRMDAGATPRPIGMLLAGFFLRLGLTFAVLYASLKYLNGSVFALAAGLALGLLSLSFEGLRMMQRGA